MDNDAGMRPRLIEASAENYLYSVLSRCNYHRTTVYYYVLNIGISILFVMIAGFTLYRCYTNKPSEYEKMLKLRRDQEYVLSKYGSAKKSTITNKFHPLLDCLHYDHKICIFIIHIF